MEPDNPKPSPSRCHGGKPAVKHPNVASALNLLTQLGFPRAQLNDRSALTLLALAGVGPDDTFAEAVAPLIGITPIMDWVRTNYNVDYKPNTRETVRRQTVHQFRDAGLVLYNPDDPARPVNSPKAVYQLTPSALQVIRLVASESFEAELAAYVEAAPGLSARYARERNLLRVAVTTSNGQILSFSAGAHSQLIRQIIVEFAERFVPGADLIYAGDTGEKLGFFDREKLTALGVSIDEHGKMPDVVLHDRARDWLILAEAVTSHGPVDGKRYAELKTLFQKSRIGLVFVTAFPDRQTMARYLPSIAWETEVWTADAPSHLIHFNGERFLGPY